MAGSGCDAVMISVFQTSRKCDNIAVIIKKKTTTILNVSTPLSPEADEGTRYSASQSTVA